MADGRNHWRVRHRSKVGEVRPGDEQQGARTRKAPRERMDARHRFASRTFRHGAMTSSPLALSIGTAAPFAQFESGKDESWACSASPLPQMVRPTNSAEISSRRQPKSVPGAHPSARWSERAKGASAVHPEACGLWV